MVTHNPEHLDYAHRVFYMKDGKIEHEVVNKKKKQHKVEKETVSDSRNNEFDILLKIYQVFPELKSKCQMRMK